MFAVLAFLDMFAVAWVAFFVVGWFIVVGAIAYGMKVAIRRFAEPGSHTEQPAEHSPEHATEHPTEHTMPAGH